ncbi:unnamed protein product [Musa acuminata subsp. burmannicoides]
MAKLVEQAERYKEMEYMEKVVVVAREGEELMVEEHNLLSVAYKNVIAACRASCQIVSIEQKEGRGNHDHVVTNDLCDNVATTRGYRARIESELDSIYGTILRLLDAHLIPVVAADSKVFYLNMKGEYYRNLAEFKTGSKYRAVTIKISIVTARYSPVSSDTRLYQ